MIEFHSVIIRRAVADDVDRVFELLKQLWPDKVFVKENTRAAFRRGLQHDIYICLEAQGNVAGFCSLSVKNSLWEDGELAHISELVVDHQLRGNGFGTALIQSAIKLAQDRGCKRIELDSAFHRDVAHEFYETLGFERRAYLFSLKLRRDE